MRRTEEREPLLVNSERSESVVYPDLTLNEKNVYRIVRKNHRPIKNYKPINFPRVTVAQIGRDIYYHLIKMSWWAFLVSTVVIYLSLSTVFFVLYATIARDGFDPKPTDLNDIFFFSFGRLTGVDGRFDTPGFITEIIAICESFCCVILTAMLTGIMYFRFSRPNARIMFTNHILFTKFNGKPAIIYRTANSRTTHIMEAQAQLWAILREPTAEGVPMHRLYNLRLQREVSPTFSVFPWSVIHVLDETSPLFGVTPEKLVQWNCVLSTMVSGVDSMFGDTVHAEKTWRVEDFRFGGQWVDIMKDEGETRICDYMHFHDIECLTEEVLYL